MALPGFEESAFVHNGVTRTLYRRGTGPGVVVLHEIPGITPAVARFAERVAAAGLTAVLPVLFGTPGKPVSAGYALGQLARVCLAVSVRRIASCTDMVVSVQPVPSRPPPLPRLD